MGCTLPAEVGGDRPVPRWIGVEQDADNDGLTVETDCDDANPDRGALPEVCDNVDNDCDDLTDEDGVCAVTELFELHGNLDVLIVVDASDEATEARDRFLQVLPSVLQPLFRGELTSQVAVVGANGTVDAIPWGTAQSQPFVRSWTSGLAEATAWVTEAIEGLPGEEPPRPLDVARAAVRAATAQHESFDRPRTKLAILFVTPGSDASTSDPTEVLTELDHSQTGRWMAWAVMSPFDGSCEPPEGELEVATESPLRDLVAGRFGTAHIFDACAVRFEHLRRRLATEGDLVAGTARTLYPLAHPFQDDTLTVSHVVARQERVLDGYIATGRTLTFPNPLPAEGVLRVEYDLAP